MACIEPGAAAALEAASTAADAVDESVKDEDLECEGRSFVVDAVVEAVVVGIKDSSRNMRKLLGLKSPAGPTTSTPAKPETLPVPSSSKQPVDAAAEEAEMPQPSPPQQQAFLPFAEEWPKKLVRC